MQVDTGSDQPSESFTSKHNPFTQGIAAQNEDFEIKAPPPRRVIAIEMALSDIENDADKGNLSSGSSSNSDMDANDDDQELEDDSDAEELRELREQIPGASGHSSPAFNRNQNSDDTRMKEECSTPNTTLSHQNNFDNDDNHGETTKSHASTVFIIPPHTNISEDELKSEATFENITRSETPDRQFLQVNQPEAIIKDRSSLKRDPPLTTSKDNKKSPKITIEDSDTFTKKQDQQTSSLHEGEVTTDLNREINNIPNRRRATSANNKRLINRLLLNRRSRHRNLPHNDFKPNTDQLEASKSPIDTSFGLTSLKSKKQTPVATNNSSERLNYVTFPAQENTTSDDFPRVPQSSIKHSTKRTKNGWWSRFGINRMRRNELTSHEGVEDSNNSDGHANLNNFETDNNQNKDEFRTQKNEKYGNQTVDPISVSPGHSSEDIDRFFTAYYHIKDAMQGRDKHGIVFVRERGPTAKFLFDTRNSGLYGYLYISMVCLHVIGSYFEHTRRPGFWLWSALPISFYFIDSAVKMYYMSVRNYFSKRWNIVQVACSILFLIDLISLIHGHVQPFRLLRPWIYLSKDKELRRFFQALFAMYKMLANLMLYYIIYVTFFAAIGVHLFNQMYQQTCDSALTGAFDDILIASVHMFTLTTSENYPSVMFPAFFTTSTSFIFFGLFSLIAFFYVMPMVLALVNDAFWQSQARQWKKDRKKERKTLIKAFNLLDVNSAGWLSREQWCDFMAVVKPKLPRTAHELTYDLACSGHPVLNWENFLEITRVLKSKLRVRRNKLRTVSDRWQPLQKRLHTFVTSQAGNLIICCLIALHWLSFCLKWEGRPMTVELVLKAIETFTVMIFVLELAVKSFVFGWLFDGDTAVLKIPVFALEYLFVTCGLVSSFVYWTGISTEGYVSVIGSAPQLLRLAYRFKGNLEFLQIVDGILEISFKLIAMVAFVMYSYSVMGLELYRDIPAFDPFYCASSFDEDGCVIEGTRNNETNPTPGTFDNLGCTTLAIFQVFTTEDWDDIMEGVMEFRSNWDSLFFISL
eukprot:gene6750-370_t